LRDSRDTKNERERGGERERERRNSVSKSPPASPKGSPASVPQNGYEEKKNDESPQNKYSSRSPSPDRS
jgi:hypothetical protein